MLNRLPFIPGTSSFINCACNYHPTNKVTYFCHLHVWLCYPSVSACPWMCGFAYLYLSLPILYYSCGTLESWVGGLRDQGQGHWLCGHNFLAKSYSLAAVVMGLSSLSQSMGPHSPKINNEPYTMLSALKSQVEPLKLEEVLYKFIVYLITGVFGLSQRLVKSIVGKGSRNHWINVNKLLEWTEGGVVFSG